MSKRIIVSGIAGLMALGLGAGIAQYAVAEQAIPAAPAATVNVPQKPVANDIAPAHKTEGGSDVTAADQQLMANIAKSSIESLAKKIGKTPAQVEKAVEAVANEQHAANKNVDLEKATPAQRKAALAKVEAAATKSLAKKLGVAESALTKAINEVKTEQLAAHGGELKARLDKAVKAGELTQAEADSILKAVTEKMLGR